jgi:hypothetical protein
MAVGSVGTDKKMLRKCILGKSNYLTVREFGQEKREVITRMVTIPLFR